MEKYRILVSILGKIGDSMYGIPTIKAIRRKAVSEGKDPHITFIFHNAYKDLYDLAITCPDIDKIYMPTEPQQFLHPHPGQWSILLRNQYPDEPEDAFLFDKQYSLTYQLRPGLVLNKHNNIEVFALIANEQGANIDINTIDKEIDINIEGEYSPLNSIGDFISIHPHTDAPERLWTNISLNHNGSNINEIQNKSKANWEELIRIMKEYKFVTLGLENESMYQPEGDRVINLCGKTNLYEYAQIVKMSKLHISIDSMGSLHIASKMRVPSICIYTVTHTGFTGVFQSNWANGIETFSGLIRPSPALVANTARNLIEICKK